MIIGKLFYDEMEDANEVLAPIFFYPFMIIFYYIGMNMFSVKHLFLNSI